MDFWGYSMTIDKQALRISELEELNELLREKVKKLESDLWDKEQLRHVYSEKSFDLQCKVRELEARAVNLPKRSVGEVMLLSGFSRDYAEGWCAGNDNAIHEIRAAGIKVKG